MHFPLTSGKVVTLTTDEACELYRLLAPVFGPPTLPPPQIVVSAAPSPEPPSPPNGPSPIWSEAPSNAELLKLAKKHPAPQEWYDEGMT